MVSVRIPSLLRTLFTGMLVVVTAAFVAADGEPGARPAAPEEGMRAGAARDGERNAADQRDQGGEKAERRTRRDARRGDAL
ncbi:MAG: hypothetical protein QHJ73_17825, partial [Armatimonadota bacterium]|nr:hypothetical protein [Armatimonadota bacterium]